MAQLGWRVSCAGGELPIRHESRPKTQHGVTLLAGVNGLQPLLAALRRGLGTAGRVAGRDSIELHGDQRERLAQFLKAHPAQLSGMPTGPAPPAPAKVRLKPRRPKERGVVAMAWPSLAELTNPKPGQPGLLDLWALDSGQKPVVAAPDSPALDLDAALAGLGLLAESVPQSWRTELAASRQSKRGAAARSRATGTAGEARRAGGRTAVVANRLVHGALGIRMSGQMRARERQFYSSRGEGGRRTSQPRGSGGRGRGVGRVVGRGRGRVGSSQWASGGKKASSSWWGAEDEWDPDDWDDWEQDDCSDWQPWQPEQPSEPVAAVQAAAGDPVEVAAELGWPDRYGEMLAEVLYEGSLDRLAEFDWAPAVDGLRLGMAEPDAVLVGLEAALAGEQAADRADRGWRAELELLAGEAGLEPGMKEYVAAVLEDVRASQPSRQVWAGLAELLQSLGFPTDQLDRLLGEPPIDWQAEAVEAEQTLPEESHQEGWNCPACTFENGRALLACAVCDTIRPDVTDVLEY